MATLQEFRFHFEFPSKGMAEHAITQLRMEQFTSELRWDKESKKWLCTSTRVIDRKATPIVKIHAYLYKLIEAYSGTYRGHELIQEERNAQPSG